MGLTVYPRHPYSDVTLLASTDADADSWRLEGERDDGGWAPVEAVIECSNANWTTRDLTMWKELRQGGAEAVRRTHPPPTLPPGVEIGETLAVMWDVSSYTWNTPVQRRLRFTGPLSETFEFKYDTLTFRYTTPYKGEYNVRRAIVGDK